MENRTEKLTAEELANMIDQTLLKPEATEDDLRAHCRKAAEYHFKTVAINNAPVVLCRKLRVLVCSAMLRSVFRSDSVR